MHKPLALCTLLCSIPALAQLANTTSLVGAITDESGAVVPGVTVTGINDATRDTYTGLTNATGNYELQFVRIGTYTITAAKPGFQTARKTGVQVDINQVVRTDFQLRIGDVSQTVTIDAAPPPIATDEASLSEIISQRTAADLPLNGRDPLQLAVTTPGVIHGMKSPKGNVSSTTGGGEDFIGAGTREIQNSVSLDGASIMTNLVTQTTFRPSVDAIQEFHIQTGTYSAQYGSYIGVQINMVTKSGTNQLHGATWEFLRNDALDARNFFNLPPKPKAPLRQNQFGIEAGGPVYIPKLYDGRNRTFFMADYEGLRSNQTLTALAAVLTPRMRQGDFSELLPKTIVNPLASGRPVFPGNLIPEGMLSPQAQNALQFMPLPNLPGTSNNFSSYFPNNNITNQTIERVDENLTTAARFFFRYAWENTNLVNGVSNPYNGYNQPVQDRNYAAGYTHILGPAAVNDFRFAHHHTSIAELNFFTDNPALKSTQFGMPNFDAVPGNPGIPDFEITGYLPIGGQNMSSSNWFQTESTWQVTDVFNYTRGAHSVAAGLELRKLVTGRTGRNSARGLLTFSGTITGNAAADLVLGLPLNVTTPGPEIPGLVAAWRDGFFVTDNWQVSRKLTLNYGLRYELPTVPYTINGNATELNAAQTQLIPANPPQPGFQFINPSHRDFAPRLGFAYRARGNTVVRGGAGVYYNANQMNSFTFLNANPPFGLVYTYNSNATNPTLSLNNPAPAASQSTGGAVNVTTVNPNLPPARMYQWSLDLERSLWRNAALDVQYLGSHTIHLDRNYYSNTPLVPGAGAVAARRPNQLWGVIRVVQNDEISNYESLNVVLRQRMSHGLTALLAYTWAHALDISTDSNGSGQPQNPYDWHADYGNANWDIRHRLVASWVYELPFFRAARQPIVRALAGGWQINGLTTIQSGTSINVTAPGDAANTSPNSSERPNLVAKPSADCGPAHLTNCISTAAFALVPAGTYAYGNAGRNLLHGPGQIGTDFSLFKNFPIRERAKLQLRGEFFNVFNTPSFTNPAAVFSTATFGSITSTLNENRQVQVAAKVVF